MGPDKKIAINKRIVGPGLLQRMVRRTSLGKLHYAKLYSSGLEVKKESEDDKNQLAGDEDEQPFESSFHEAVVVQPHPQEIHAEPGKGCDDISENGQHHHTEVSYQAAKACVENHRAPEHDHQRTVFFRVPTPEATP